MFLSNSGNYVAPVITALAVGGYTAVAIGGLVSCLIYCLFGFIFSRIPVDSIYKIFPKSLIGAVTVVIGVNLMPFILSYVKMAELGEQQYSYQNLYVTGLIKKGGILVSNIEDAIAFIKSKEEEFK